MGNALYTYQGLRDLVRNADTQQREAVRLLLTVTKVEKIMGIPVDELDAYGFIIAKICSNA